MNKTNKKINYIYTLFLMFFTILAITLPSFAFGPSSDVIYQGIDVSSWQRTINFSNVKSSGVDVVYIKSSEGKSYIDPYFETNYRNAKANGLKIGFYHYVTARSTSQAQEQAIFFAKVIAGKEIDCRLAMDFESFGNLSISDRNQFTNGIFLSSTTPLPTPETSGNSSTENTIVYTVKRGDTLSEIAQKFGTTVSSIVSLNPIIKNPNLIYPGQQFTIKTNSDYSTGTTNNTVYVVKRGDTLSQIAVNYNTTVNSLVNLNNIKNPNLIFPGQKIIISSSYNISNGQNSCGKILYKIVYGDTLSQIALRYNTTVQEIVKLNNISNPNLIYAGTTIRIPNCR